MAITDCYYTPQLFISGFIGRRSLSVLTCLSLFSSIETEVCLDKLIDQAVDIFAWMKELVVQEFHESMISHYQDHGWGVLVVDRFCVFVVSIRHHLDRPSVPGSSKIHAFLRSF